eukprot:14921022-Ditylum_brightwellii.AAC.1
MDSSSSKSLSSGSKKSKFVLNNNLKAILHTNCGLSNDQVKEMVEAYNSKTRWPGHRENHFM